MTTTPLGWLTLLASAVFVVVKAYDALTVSIDEQKKKLEDACDAYEKAKTNLANITSELEQQEKTMDELLAKKNLTYAEKGELEKLQAITAELRIQKDLAERTEQITQKQVAKEAVKLYEKQFGSVNISQDAIQEAYDQASLSGNNALLISDENDISAMIAGYKQFNKLLKEAYASKNQEDIEHFKEFTEDVSNSIFETAQKLQQQKNDFAAYYDTIKDIKYDSLTSEQKKVIDTYNAISDAIELIYQNLDPNTWKSIQIYDIFSKKDIEANSSFHSPRHSPLPILKI